MAAQYPGGQKDFRSWLEDNEPEEASAIFSSLTLLDVLMRKNGVICSRLLIDDADTIEKMADDIKKNKGLKIHDKKRRVIALKGLYAYKNFLELKASSEKAQLSDDDKNVTEVDADVDTASKSKSGVLIASFTEKRDYSYTRPLSVTYFGTTYATKNWSALYVQSVNCLLADYPDEIRSLIGKNISGRGRVDISEASGISDMEAPKELNDNLYLETNCSAVGIIGKIRQLMDVCAMDYSAMHIEYMNKGSNTNTIAPDEFARIRATLDMPKYNYGFKDNDDVELYRFRAFYAETTGVECSLEKEDLLRVIRSMGFEFDGKVYTISEDTMSGIESEIRGYMDLGVSIIYYEELYDLRSDDYFDAKIVSAGMLKAILKKLLPEFRYKNNYLALPEEKLTELQLVSNDIIRVWGDCVLQTYDELSLKLPLIPLDKIKSTLQQQPMFIWNSAETYLQEDSFEADEDEISRLIEFIDEQCGEHGSASLDEMPFENLKAHNPELSESAIINCFFHLIDDRFERNARILTRKGAGKDTYTAVLEFCRKQEKCTYDRLVRIAEKVAGTVRTPEVIEAANSVMVRIDKDNFIADGLISFDVDRVDSALDQIVTNEFIGMKEITTFSTLPFCGYGWNLFLLESYCRRFSKKYGYVTRRANSSNSGAVVAKTCELSYFDIMAEAVARSGRELSKDEVFDFLTETGYMERKRSSNIEKLIIFAKKLRERRM